MLIAFDSNNLTTDSTKLFVALLSTGIPPIDLKKKEVKGVNSSFFPINFILKPKYDLINIAITISNDFEWGTTAIIYFLSLGSRPLSLQPKIFVRIILEKNLSILRKIFFSVYEIFFSIYWYSMKVNFNHFNGD